MLHCNNAPASNRFHATAHAGDRRDGKLHCGAKIGCTGQTLKEQVKKAEIDAGERGGVPTDMPRS